MERTTVFFVRHATPNFNNHDDLTRELAPKGLEDRKLVTEFLWDKDIEVAISSPYKRAFDTIKEFADARGLECHGLSVLSLIVINVWRLTNTIYSCDRKYLPT